MPYQLPSLPVTQDVTPRYSGSDVVRENFVLGRIAMPSRDTRWHHVEHLAISYHGLARFSGVTLSQAHGPAPLHRPLD
jgi:hypothetical protein